jgi:glycosyltransferase involved in cell wall biosynthesis
MNREPKVSVVTVVLNGERTLQECIQSVAIQTYRNIEHIIIDGASTDGTLQIIKNSPSVSKWISEKDTGLYHAMNRGIEMAEGDIIGILNADDALYDASVIGNIVHAFNTSGADAVYGDLVFTHKINRNRITRRWISGNYRPERFRRGWMPPHPTLYLHRNIYEQFGLFNTSLDSSADYELMVRLLMRYHIRMHYLPKILVSMRTGGKSTGSILNRLRANRQDLRAWKVNGLIPHPLIRLLKPFRKLNQFF